jgi:hypothetical protein
MHQLKKVDMLSAKMDPLMKKLEDRVSEKKEVMHINDSRMTRGSPTQTPRTLGNFGTCDRQPLSNRTEIRVHVEPRVCYHHVP